MQIAIGAILLAQLKSKNSLEEGLASIVVGLVRLFVMSFAWSWGPLGWLIPSEMFPLETRTLGYAFLSMMCHMRAFIFFFFTCWIMVIGLFILFLLPETKNIPINIMVERVWKRHPIWKRFMDHESKTTYHSKNAGGDDIMNGIEGKI